MSTEQTKIELIKTAGFEAGRAMVLGMARSEVAAALRDGFWDDAINCADAFGLRVDPDDAQTDAYIDAFVTGAETMALCALDGAEVQP